jgi:hypothetical protein
VRTDPDWFLRLQKEARQARKEYSQYVIVRVDDLEQCVGQADSGRGGTALVGRDASGEIAIDYQRLLKCVFLTDDEARHFATTILNCVQRAD